MALPIENNVKFQPLALLLGAGRLVGLGAAGLLGLVGLLALPLVLKRQYDYYFGFDRQEWQAVGVTLRGNRTGLYHNPRTHMLSDILAHHLQRGLTRAQAVAELGPADSEFSAGPYTTVLRYYVGGNYPVVALGVALGRNGRVQHFAQVMIDF